ncbi:isovaleryl-CoA dehydrogenase [Pollutimonas harenae]|uniref:Isovaleryl-CoA dehydrogenase n=1 Tax=Pollutimonas harenae TaxID=657015 RepID=A0A853H3B4_9BURK|nr:isovaleryl-CoA dehydrogenase [Pollutimonas harenae]NYT86520.1 isovaleryl-CoA dehydrogenase [Pollutimonas harenae]TEA69737.1 isovaleryl-CoA dehydrogenase [Pollutimonas harenae]
MGWTTHEVTNQVPELGDYNLYSSDIALQEGVRREGGQSREDALLHYGERLGKTETFAMAHEANRHRPELESYDRQGHRVDRVRFHPAWHRFLRMAFLEGMHASAWSAPGKGAHVARAAIYLMHGQLEAGSLCPVTMTSAAIPVLKQEPWFDTLAPLLYSTRYDERDLPLADKTSMMVGMGMTEKQGGSDLRSNTTRAVPLGTGGRGMPYRLTGHKWFFSSPTSDAHLVLAGHDEVFSCFYVPRWLDDGSRNSVHIQRLKNKMGNASNASAEVEFQDATGVLVGEAGRGIATLVEMASYTRLDCVLGSAALLRQGLVQALHHARYRVAFGRLLNEQPLMQSVLMDLSLESEAATILALRLARAFDDTDNDPLELAYRRLLTPAAKFWICKRTIAALGECMEVWGGNGYIEDAPMARLYREAPVNSIWEGSGNVMCLDVLRGLKRHPELAVVLLDSLESDCADEPVLKQRVASLLSLLTLAGPDQEAAARYIAQELVLLVQASLLRRHAPLALADAFIHSRFQLAGRVYGALPAPLALRTVLERSWPV